MTRALFLAVATVLCVLSSAFAQVSPAVTTNNATTRLVAEHVSAAPGETITLALLQNLREKWHVYWRNPGDSGLPLNLSWKVSEGFEAGEVLYPLPHQLPLGPLVNYGHEGEPTFLIPLTVPQNAVPGMNVSVTVDATWLICDEERCVPEDGTLRLILPITAERGALNTPYQERIAAARAEQPTPPSFEVSYFHTDEGPVLRLEGPPEGTLEFYPYTPSLTEPAGEVRLAQEGETLFMGFTAAFAYEAARPERLGGVLVVEEDGTRTGYELFAPQVKAPATSPFPVPVPLTSSAAATPAPPLLGVTLGLAFLGGVILNLMPCVFPIVFLKALGFASVSREERGIVRRHGLLYTAGILVAFLGLAGMLLALRAGGDALGWGFHLQSPLAVGVFAIIILLVGLNLSGVFEMGTSLQGVGEGLARQGGSAGSFFTGLLAVAVAAPCIGPFLGGAVGVALARPAVEGLLIFGTIGLGLAAPYLLLSFVPGFVSLLPKPGAWMETLKQLFAFAMYATLVWLVWVVSTQAGSDGVLRVGLALLVTGLAAWTFGRAQGAGGLFGRLASIVLLLGAVVPLLGVTPKPVSAQTETSENALTGVPYDEDVLATLRADGVPVFVDFTASWCITCQFNKKTVLDTAQVRKAFAVSNVTYMVADWTVRDPVITAALEAQGRAGVPLYLYYPAAAQTPQILPQLLTVEGVLETLE